MGGVPAAACWGFWQNHQQQADSFAGSINKLKLSHDDIDAIASSCQDLLLSPERQTAR